MIASSFLGLVASRFANYRQLTPAVIEEFQAERRAQKVGSAMIRKTLAVLQGILTRAVVRGLIASNPVAAIDKPKQRRSRSAQAIPPSTVEAIRSRLLKAGRRRDATLVSVLAYAGLRPGEALALRWGDIRKRTIAVERALALGEVKDTKTDRGRTVRLLATLSSDLAEWKLASGRPNDSALVFPRRDGTAWTDCDYRNWRKRVFADAAKAVGLEAFRPYDLRHSFVSLLIAEGASVLEVARQAGHSPTMALNVYGHIIEELADGERLSAETAIRKARDSGAVAVAGVSAK
jgi:integrase